MCFMLIWDAAPCRVRIEAGVSEAIQSMVGPRLVRVKMLLLSVFLSSNKAYERVVGLITDPLNF